MATVSVEALGQGDEQRLVRMFDRLSPATRYKRFFSPVPVMRPAVWRALTDVDHDGREAVVARVGDEIVAIAHYYRDRDDVAAAEVAVLVEDAWQRHGVGRCLMRELGRLSRARGITRLLATTLPDNLAAIGLARAMSPGMTPRWDDGVVELRFPEVAVA
jgi:GNAT superfamily N-acetyltransferase